ncbi:hypothetical protein BX600DRAFT_441127 [Xylariales sp. PMI_506]|nr:hypothetical protein BX600DRAFT_441127 [Xylariales sp. PMI_506]
MQTVSSLPHSTRAIQAAASVGMVCRATKDHASTFDWDSSGKMDHIALYCPGTGVFCCLRNSNGAFQPVFSEGHSDGGIGTFDLRETNDLAFAFDWSHSGKNDYVVLYRHGRGVFYVLSRKTGTFIPVFALSRGLGGFDLLNNADRLFSFDYDHSGKAGKHCCIPSQWVGHNLDTEPYMMMVS